MKASPHRPRPAAHSDICKMSAYVGGMVALGFTAGMILLPPVVK